MSDSRAPSRPPAPSRSHSRRAVSRPRTSRNTSVASILYLPTGPAALIDPDGPIDEEAAELLQEFIHPHHHAEDALVEEDNAATEEAIQQWRRGLPWWKRPSPWWSVIVVRRLYIIDANPGSLRACRSRRLQCL